jgi:putative restriction endonuclease
MDFDFPVYKRLASNDTGQAKGHQGGIVIPKDIEDYFPDLRDQIIAGEPTVDVFLTAELLVDGQYFETVQTRYQYQTWGGTRSPERRLTSSLGPIRNQARKDDFLIIERSLMDDKLYRLNLIGNDSSIYKNLDNSVGNSRWGPLSEDQVPIKNSDIRQASDEIESRILEPFRLLAGEVTYKETRTKRIARSVAFRKRILDVNRYKCAITGTSLKTPKGQFCLDAAHIVPLEKNGTDDIRNGLSLTKDLHWCFDRGLFGFNQDRRIIVPRSVSQATQNKFITDLAGKTLVEPKESNQSPNDEALAWHRENILID